MHHCSPHLWIGCANRTAATTAAMLAGVGSVSAQDLEPIDLSSWTAEGFTSNWSVQSGGDSVIQTVNGPPTFFVSPGEFLNTTLRGSFQVETTSDDDFIGFVFGYNNPLGSETSARDFFVFDWKQTEQSFSGAFAEEGLTLARVVGDIPPGPGVAGSAAEIKYLFDHPDTGPTPDADGVISDVLGADYGAGRGWLDQTAYEFELLYQEDRIRIRLSGGQFGDNLQTIFDIMAADAGLAAFSAGRFGFYNLSQQNVRYTGFTEQDTPISSPDTPPTIVPTPAALPAGLALLGGWGLIRRRRT